MKQKISIFTFILILIIPGILLSDTGKIQGIIKYDGEKSGSIHVVVISLTIDKSNPVSWQKIAIETPGSFEISSLKNGFYLVGAFLDANNDNLPHYNEPVGVYQKPIYISAENNVAEISFGLFDLPKGTSSYEGKVDVGTLPVTNETIYIIAAGLSPAPISIAATNSSQNYEFSLPGLAGGRYIIAAFIDMDGNRLPGLSEPVAAIPQIQSLNNDEMKTVADIVFANHTDFSGNISGTVTTNANDPGKTMVICAGLSKTPLSVTAADPRTGNYALTNLADGTYIVFAYRDMDENILFTPGEPFSESYLEPFCLCKDDNSKIIDLALQEAGNSSIAGTVSYDGDQHGFIATILLGLSPTPLNIALLPSPGNYQFNNLAAGVYFSGSFMDVNTNALPEEGEPVGLYTKDFILLNKDSQVAPIDIVLEDAPDAAISGTIYGPENVAGEFNVVAIGYATTPLKIRTFSTAGSYKVDKMGYGKYLMACFLDINGNGMYEINEPFDFTKEMVIVPQNTEISDIDFVLTTNVNIPSFVAENIRKSDARFMLAPNYPNPFNPSTTIGYNVPDNAHVVIKIYNMLGQEITTLVDEYQQKGEYSIRWNACDITGNPIPAGNYLYWMQAGDFSDIKCMCLIK